MATDDPSVVAIAADERSPETHLPWLTREDIAMMADFIEERLLG